jgi:hypothetical protein
LISLYLKQAKDNMLSKEKLESLLIQNYVEKCYAGEIFIYDNKGKLDSMIIGPFCHYGDGQVVEYRDHIFFNLSDTSKYYSRLKELYKKEKNPILIYSIAKYKREEDTSIIIKGLTDAYYSDLTFGQRQTFWSYKSIYENPKPLYFRHLVKASERLFDKIIGLTNEEVLYYYLAILKYENNETIGLLKKIVERDKKSINSYNRLYIWAALKETNSDYFRDYEQKVNITEEENKWAPNLIINFKQSGLYKK